MTQVAGGRGKAKKPYVRKKPRVDRPTPYLDERVHDMVAMYNSSANPKTLEEIGDAFGISRERVRQIFEAYGIPRRQRSYSRKVRRIAKERFPHAH